MKPFLLYRDRDFNPHQKLAPNEQTITQDLGLDTLFNAMALDDDFLFEVARKVVLSGLDNDPDTILYRQGILKDCLKTPAVVREIYSLAVEAIERRKNSWFLILRGSSSPSSILYNSEGLLHIFVDILRKLRAVTDKHAEQFGSEGLAALSAMLKKELTDEYLETVENHLKELRFSRGVLISAELGNGNVGANYTLRKPHCKNQGWLRRLFARKPPVYSFCIGNRDQIGARALSELCDKGINLIANTLAQSVDHILSFLSLLRTELAFYICCLNLYEQLTQYAAPICFPLPRACVERSHSFKGLYNPCLALILKHAIVGNDLNADNRNSVMITGANQGGKSTFLGSIGVAQLMMQCGMFVPAESFCGNVCDGLFTHYKRKEDATMNRGKLDEELGRMSDIVDNITPNAMLLFNESFAATNEREGSEIAAQITRALVENNIKVFFVTHLYGFAHGVFEERAESGISLRAERRPDGGRTFKMIQGEPLQTSYGEDLYKSIFGTT